MTLAELRAMTAEGMLQATIALLREWIRTEHGEPREQINRQTRGFLEFVDDLERPKPERRRQVERLLYLLERSERESFEKLLQHEPGGPNFPFALMEWQSYSIALEAVRRRERG